MKIEPSSVQLERRMSSSGLRRADDDNFNQYKLQEDYKLSLKLSPSLYNSN